MPNTFRAARGCAAVLCIVLLAACDSAAGAPAAPLPPPPTAAPTATRVPPTATPAPKVVSLASVKAALQNVVDIERRAVSAGNQDEFLSQIDPGDRDWYHLEEGEFTGSADMIARLNCVSAVRLDPSGQTAQADVALDQCPGRYHEGMFFRLVDGHWLQSQPGLDEQGLRDTKQIGPWRVTFHELDARYLPELERLAPGIYARVSGMMGVRNLDVDVDLVSRPSDMPQSAFTTIALYDPMIARLSVLSPFYWPNGDGTEAQIDDQIRTTLTHEFTHHAVRTIALLAVPHWLNEGIAVYVSGESPTEYVRLVQQVALIHRLQPPNLLNDMLQDGSTAGLAYAEGYSFVRYLTKRAGDAVLPALLRSLRGTGDLNASLLAVTGSGLPAWWAAWQRSVLQ